MDITSNYHKGNNNSRDANQKRSRQLRQKVFAYILSRKRGATVYEICQALGLKHQTASARATELKAAGSVVDSGERRKTDTGCYAAVLKASRS